MTKHLFKPSLAGMAMLAAMCGYAAAQTAPQNNEPAQTTQSMQSTQNLQLVSANARLMGGVNSNDAMQGQMVKAKLTSDVKTADGMKLDDGTVLIGKVEQVQKSQNDGPAKLSLVFDQMRLKDGKTVPVKATLLGVYPAGTGNYWAATGMSGSMMPMQPHNIANDHMVDQEPGELGHVAMHSAVQSDVSGVFTSKDDNINLKRGTMLQVAIAPEMTTAG